MQHWKKETFKSKRALVLLQLAAALTIFNYFIFSLTLSAMLAAIIALFVFSHFFHRYFTLQLKDKRKTVRLFPGDQASISFQFRSRSIVQFFYGKLTFQTSNAIQVQNVQNKMERREMTEYFIDVSSAHDEYTLDIVANKRGRAVLRNIELQIFDLLFLGHSDFIYQPFYKTEVIVLPKIQPVSGIEVLFSNEIGNQPAIYSYFQDPTLISGVRDYVPTDSFQQIHWKATARTGNIQTKILEKTTHQKWTFLLNIMEDENGNVFTFSLSTDLENRLSHLAYMFQTAVRLGVTFELFVNITSKNNHHVLHLEEGAGNEHCIKALEILARIDQTSNTIKMSPFLNRVAPHLRQSTCVILCGMTKQDVVRVARDTYVHAIPMYELNSKEFGGILNRC